MGNIYGIKEHRYQVTYRFRGISGNTGTENRFWGTWITRNICIREYRYRRKLRLLCNSWSVVLFCTVIPASPPFISLCCTSLSSYGNSEEIKLIAVPTN